ncbi:MAG TPA: NAD-dependent epimerase [Erwinia persicina]|uniref:NAD-dependent epimerase n=1 Tax=Erwinia persicina TaxID=55211 RepID=A0A4U3FKX3_9GAMM|nr:D-erythronate dehydrogenase [Erwinia persicina]TKJ93775.1 NAD-dependent epimerase [Erwinia persicina]HBI06954.1 NAD-dependent epimerase [Erwinia persicina]HBQ80694.1 NAD-dependent epimerase [Erwinia persicina]HBT30229.1 NAD-dependent epimerase [Erwinia persicina]
MNIVVTGAAGFLGKKLLQALLAKGSLNDAHGQPQIIKQITAIDIIPVSGIEDPRLTVRCGDISSRSELETLIDARTDSVFHLAAIVSGQAEQDFDLGMKINVDAARQIMERLRALPQCVRLVTTSSVAVFGGALPDKVPDDQVWRPQSSYGTQKAINDLLLSDYSRRGFLDGRSLRMPTIVVRPGKPNAAASSFASGIIREPLNGEKANCPVSPATRLWLMSPARAVQALILGHELKSADLDQGRVINLNGLSVTVEEMLASLRRISGDEVLSRISYQPDQAIINIVNSWPGDFHASYAHRLGFRANNSFDEMVREYLAESDAA